MPRRAALNILRRTEPDRHPDDARGLRPRDRVDLATKTPPLLECTDRMDPAGPPGVSVHASSPYASW
jgi:hypothetical protein